MTPSRRAAPNGAARKRAVPKPVPSEPLSLTPGQRAAWEEAQALWNVHVHDPVARPDAGGTSFGWFQFPTEVSFDLPLAARMGVDSFLVSLFAHEIGHHVLSPSTRVDSVKIRHQMARALTASDHDPRRVPTDAALLSNLWSDMLINVRVARLQRSRDDRLRAEGEQRDLQPEMVRMWRTLAEGADRPSPVFWLMHRAYESLWALPAGTLAHSAVPVAPRAAERIDPDRVNARDRGAGTELDDLIAVQNELAAFGSFSPEFDAVSLADTVRRFADDPVAGAVAFGMIAAPYLAVRGRGRGPGTPEACGGETDSDPVTAAELESVLGDPRLQAPTRHPGLVEPLPSDEADGGPDDGQDDGLDGEDAAHDETADASDDKNEDGGRGQRYGLAETLALYRSSDDHAVVSAWYQSAARRWVAPLLQRSSVPARSDESIPGAIEQWQLGDEFADLDWAATLARGATVVPGVTTRRREWLPDTPPPVLESVELDLYIDSSGSMRHPESESPAVLAGTILVLSTLRGHGRVRITSFSGPGQVAGASRFLRNRAEAMAELTTYFGGGTTFPLDLFAARYEKKAIDDTTRRHVVVLSDDGLSSLFGQGQPQYAHVARRVRSVLDTATLIIDGPGSVDATAAEAGYDVLHLAGMADAPAVCADLATRLARYEREPRGVARNAGRPVPAARKDSHG